MKKSKTPTTSSIRELATFWDTHDLADFEEELEEVSESVFVRGGAIKVPLDASEVRAVEKMARAGGVSREEFLRTWVLEHLSRRKKGSAARR